MATSSRNLPAQNPDADDDIVERKPAHPETTAMLIVAALALLVAIVLSTKQLGQYVNPETKSLTNGFTRTAVAVANDEAREFAAQHGIKSWGLDGEAEAPSE